MRRQPAALRDRSAFWIAALSWGNFAGVLLVMLLLCLVSERWWLSALLTYLPRQLYALPAAILLPGALIVCRRAWWQNVLSLLIVLGPVMGFSMPTSSPPATAATGRTPLRIVSGNVQEGSGSLIRLMQEIERFEPNLVVLQETIRGCDELHETFSDWRRVHVGSYFVASKFPLRVVDHCRSRAFDRWTTVLVEVDLPGGPILLSDLHLSTPRHGATGLTPFSLLTGDGVDDFVWHQELRRQEATETREFLDRYRQRPLLVMGDFNTPSTSSLYREFWGDFQNAFEAAGYGYGYTAPCNTDTWWPRNTPWVRIDHILADSAWIVHSCHIGRTDGSDHRLMFAVLSLSPESTAESTGD